MTNLRNINVLDWIVYILLIAGALNWGLIGLFKFNLVSAILGKIPFLENIVYILVGLAGLYFIFDIFIKKD